MTQLDPAIYDEILLLAAQRLFTSLGISTLDEAAEFAKTAIHSTTCQSLREQALRWYHALKARGNTIGEHEDAGPDTGRVLWVGDLTRIGSPPALAHARLLGGVQAQLDGSWVWAKPDDFTATSLLSAIASAFRAR
jgi:hypothetical protein